MIRCRWTISVGRSHGGRDGQAARRVERLHQTLVDPLNTGGKIDWSRGVVDSMSARAMHGVKKRARAPWIEGTRAGAAEHATRQRAGRVPAGDRAGDAPESAPSR